MQKPPFHILVLAATDHLSGPARQIIQFFEYVDRNDYNLLLAGTWKDKTGRFDLAQDEFFREMYQRKFPFQVLRQKLRFDPYVLRQAYQIVKKSNIQLIQSHGYKAAVIGLFLKWSTGIPWIAFMHGEIREDRKILIFQEIGFRLVRFADRVITVSKAMRQRYIQRGLNADKINVLHNALDPSTFHHQSQANELRERFNIKKSDQVIGVIGRLSPEKGQRYFLKAFERLKNSHPNLKALLVGEGPETKSLKQYCTSHHLENDVFFTGYQENISGFYRFIDLIVLPSLSEGLPNVVLEALFHEKPVVATRVGGIPEVIRDGFNGLLVPPRDASRLAAAMDLLLKDPLKRALFSANGKKTLADSFSPATRVKKLMHIYAAVLKEKNPQVVDPEKAA